MELRCKPGILPGFRAWAPANLEHYALHKAYVPELPKWEMGGGTIQREKPLSAHSPSEKPLAMLHLLGLGTLPEPLCSEGLGHHRQPGKM